MWEHPTAHGQRNQAVPQITCSLAGTLSLGSGPSQRTARHLLFADQGGITTRGSQSRAINRLALSDLSEILHLNDARRNRNHHTLLRRRDMWPLDVLDLVRLRLQAAPQAAVDAIEINIDHRRDEERQ